MNSYFLNLFGENRHIRLKMSVIPILLTFMYLVALNLLGKPPTQIIVYLQGYVGRSGNPWVPILFGWQNLLDPPLGWDRINWSAKIWGCHGWHPRNNTSELNSSLRQIIDTTELSWVPTWVLLLTFSYWKWERSMTTLGNQLKLSTWADKRLFGLDFFCRYISNSIMHVLKHFLIF